MVNVSQSHSKPLEGAHVNSPRWSVFAEPGIYMADGFWSLEGANMNGLGLFDPLYVNPNIGMGWNRRNFSLLLSLCE